MSDNKKFILEEEFLVTSADTDFTRRLSVSALTNMFIQIAWHHAEELGFGIEYLHQNDLAWVLSRFHLEINSLPVWNNKIRLVTWPKGIRRLFYLRDLEVYDQQGNKIAVATSEWLLIDIKSKRPKLKGPDDSIFNKNKDKHAIESEVENLVFIDKNSKIIQNKAVYSDIDLNQHLTTTRYINWMFDAFDLEFHKKHQCSGLTVNFNREIPFGEEVAINYSEILNEKIFHFCFKGNATKDFFSGKISFN